MLRALLVALFALAAGAFFAPMAAPRAAIEARSVKIQMDIAFNFNDEALDNPASRRKAAERTASHLLAALLRPAPTLIGRRARLPCMDSRRGQACAAGAQVRFVLWVIRRHPLPRGRHLNVPFDTPESGE
jgi:hypothetical protein